MKMRSIVLFYAPYTSRMMGKKFQVAEEACFPYLVQLVLASVSVIPVFCVGHWLVGLLCVAGMFLILRTIYSSLMYAASEPREEGLYVSPSLATATNLVAVVVSLGISGVIFKVTVYFTGWNIF